jgi:hypothetical protein
MQIGMSRSLAIVKRHNGDDWKRLIQDWLVVAQYDLDGEVENGQPILDGVKSEIVEIKTLV